MLPVYCQIIKYEQEQTIKQNKQTKTELHGEGQNNQRENDGESWDYDSTHADWTQKK